MNLLELARIWIHPSVQGLNYEDRNGKSHSLSVASCAVGNSLKRVREDWKMKYPNLPRIDSVISWSDDEHHDVIIYKSSIFKTTGKPIFISICCTVKYTICEKINELYLSLTRKILWQL